MPFELDAIVGIVRFLRGDADFLGLCVQPCMRARVFACLHAWVHACVRMHSCMHGPYAGLLVSIIRLLVSVPQSQSIVSAMGGRYAPAIAVMMQNASPFEMQVARTILGVWVYFGSVGLFWECGFILGVWVYFGSVGLFWEISRSFFGKHGAYCGKQRGLFLGETLISTLGSVR